MFKEFGPKLRIEGSLNSKPDLNLITNSSLVGKIGWQVIIFGIRENKICFH
jgi:hypothetical protein